MITAISKYMPRWLMAIIATALVLATLVGSSQDSAEAIDPADTDTVYIADGTNFADALMGATIASLNTSPMLGVAGTNGGDTIPGDTVEELDRLTNDKASPLDTIYIFGGTSAVSANVATQLEAWATNVERIAGDSRWGTYEAISQMLPSAIDEAVHAEEADHATTADSATEADNADTLDGMDSTEFLGATDKAADSDELDGLNSGAFVLGDGVLHEELGATESFTGNDNDLLSITFTAGDECEDGSTQHRYLVFTDAHFFTAEATNQPTRLDINFDGTDVNAGVTTINTDIRNSNPSPHAWLAGVTPGSHTVKTQGTTTGGGTIDVQRHQLTVVPAGWSCS